MPSVFTVTPMGAPGISGRRCRGQTVWSVRWCLWMRRMGLIYCTVMHAARLATGCRPLAWMMEQCFRRDSWCSGWWSLEMVVMVALWDFQPHYIYVNVLTTTWNNHCSTPDTRFPACLRLMPPPLPPKTWLLSPPAPCHLIRVPLQISWPLLGWCIPTQHGPVHAKIWACSLAYFPGIPTAGVAPGWFTRDPVRTLTSLTLSCHPHQASHPLWPSLACLSVAPRQPMMKSALASSPSMSSLIICHGASRLEDTITKHRGITTKCLRRGPVVRIDRMLKEHVSTMCHMWRNGGRGASWVSFALCLKFRG